MKFQTRPLSGTPLTDAWLGGDPDALALFPADPGDADAYRSRAQEVGSRFGRSERERAAEYLTGGGAESESRLEAWIEGEGFMVTTGQQPSLFGGPLYALYKGLTAAALASRLERLLERPVLPVFWIGSEDHSWDELRTAHTVDTGNDLRELALPARPGAPTPPVHRIPTGPETAELVRRFVELNPETDFSPRWRELLERAYTPERSLADGFETVMDALLGPMGVFLVQAHQPSLKADSAPYLLRELRESANRETKLAERVTAIEAAGFTPQVPILPEATNLLLEGSEGRERLFRDDDAFRSRGSDARSSLSEIEARVGDDPSVLSPNVLLRPVIESALLPTLSYVAGPSEAAYLPQTAPVFEAHGVGRPIVHPRLGLFVLEAKVEKVLFKFGLEIPDLAAPHHEIAGRLLREDVPAPIQSGLTELRGAIGEGSGRLQDAIAELDPTLKGPVQAFRSQSFELLGDIERKVVQALKKENEIALAQLEKAQQHLFPLGQPQERIFNPFYYLFRYDETFLDGIAERARDVVEV